MVRCIDQNVGVERRARLGRLPGPNYLAAVLDYPLQYRILEYSMAAALYCWMARCVLEVDAVQDGQLLHTTLRERPEVPAE